MEWNLRELRFFATAAETGSFTDAAAELHVSQAAVSRTIAALEKGVGERLLRRTAHGCELTPNGGQILAAAQRVLTEAERFEESVRNRNRVLRMGYAWAGLGKHTAKLQREWAAGVGRQRGIRLQLTRQPTATSGLAEGFCDVAVVRRPLEDSRFESMIIGLEKRLVAFASDDPLWSRRRTLTLDEIAQRTVATDRRTGTTDEQLWAGRRATPEFLIQSGDVEEWLDTISGGDVVGMTAEATAHHHRRPEIVYRPVKDGPRIAVRLAWVKGAAPTGLDELLSLATSLYAEG